MKERHPNDTPMFRWITYTGQRIEPMDPYDDGVYHVADANTASEARSDIKKRYGLTRIPVGNTIVCDRRLRAKVIRKDGA